MMIRQMAHKGSLPWQGQLTENKTKDNKHSQRYRDAHCPWSAQTAGQEVKAWICVGRAHDTLAQLTFNLVAHSLCVARHSCKPVTHKHVSTSENTAHTLKARPHTRLAHSSVGSKKLVLVLVHKQKPNWRKRCECHRHHVDQVCVPFPSTILSLPSSRTCSL